MARSSRLMIALRWAHPEPLFIALAILAFLLAALEVSAPGYFLHDDNATWFAGAYLHGYRVLTETGRVAVVNFYQHGGEPFLAQGQTGVLYPPVYLSELLARIFGGDPRSAIAWLAALHLMGGMAGFYCWLRERRVAPGLAAVMGLAWVLQPFILIVGSSWIVATYAAAWLPWLFWALDRLLGHTTLMSSCILGSVAGLFFLQGYVQWFADALLFLVLYATYQISTRRELWSVRVASHLSFAGLVWGVWSAPLLLPMLHAMGDSAARAQTLDSEVMLIYHLRSDILWAAQIGLFHPFMFGVSSAIFFCPALMLLPLALVRFFKADRYARHSILILGLLALLALILSGTGYYVFARVPLLDRFRWPFKLFLFVDFFSLSALAMTLASWSAGRWRAAQRAAAMTCALVVLLAESAVSISQHEGNFFSKTNLPRQASILPPGMNPTLGRVIAIDDHLPEAAGASFFTHSFATYYQVPSIGGYNPLVGMETLAFSLGLDFPNVYTFSSRAPITLEVRQAWASRAVRYWIVDPHAAHLPDFAKFQGLRLLALEPDRLIYEDEWAAPMVRSLVNRDVACPLVYSGNSLLIALRGAISPVVISIGPGDGWWSRADVGPWQKAETRGEGLVVNFPVGSRRLEVSYFDPRFQQGLLISFLLLFALVFAAVAQRGLEAIETPRS